MASKWDVEGGYTCRIAAKLYARDMCDSEARYFVAMTSSWASVVKKEGRRPLPLTRCVDGDMVWWAIKEAIKEKIASTVFLVVVWVVVVVENGVVGVVGDWARFDCEVPLAATQERW